EVRLIAEGDSENITAVNTGTIDVSAKEEGADGGFVEISGPSVIIDGNIDVTSEYGEVGTLLIDPWNFYILSYSPWWATNEDGDNYVRWWKDLPGSSFMTEGWMESFTGDIHIQALNDVFFKLGEERTWSGWTEGVYPTDHLLTLQGNNFTIEAGRHIDLGNDGIVMANGGNINLLTDVDFVSGIPLTDNGVGDIYLGSGAGLISNGGNINLVGVNINLTSLVNAGTGTVNLTAQKKILDDADRAAVDIIADTLNMSAKGIGYSCSNPYQRNDIETQVNTLNSAQARTASLYLKNFGDLYVKSASAAHNVQIEVNSNLTVGDISAASVDLDAKTGSILDDLNDTTAIRANKISLTANGNIGSTSTVGDMDAGYLDIALGGGSLSLSSKGNIYINEIASANFLTSQVTNVNTGVNAHDVFLVNSAGDITVDSAISAEDNILLAANNLNVNADISTTADDIDLIALDNVNLARNISSGDYIGITADFHSAYLGKGGDGTGTISQTAGVVGSGIEDLVLGAGSGIDLHTQVVTLEANNSKSGDITIDNIGNLTVVDSGVNNQALGGKVDINVHSDLTVASDAQITTHGGDINLTADGNVYVNNISTDRSFTGSTPPPSSGTVTITAGGNIEDNYDQNSNPDDIYDINADNIVLSAGRDIGSGSKAPIELRSNGLSIIKGNDVSLFHKGNLDFGGFSGESFSLTNAGDLTISGDITTSGDINLSVIEDPNLTINATLDSGGGDVSLSATRHILLDNFALIMTRGGNFTAQADSNNNYIGTYTMNPGSEVDTASGAATPGSVLISADDAEIYGTVFSGSGDITIAPNLDQTIGLGGGIGAFRLSDDELDNLMTTGLLTIGSSSAGDISIDDITQPGKNIALITGGKIQEQGVDFGTEIVAQSLSLQAVSGIGSGNALETEVQNLSVYNSASGNIKINNSGLLNITEVAGVAGVV
ncbi:MAG: hypothetical protein DRO40_13345, partial [Thermoprotei archaeon]